MLRLQRYNLFRKLGVIMALNMRKAGNLMQKVIGVDVAMSEFRIGWLRPNSLGADTYIMERDRRYHGEETSNGE